jgi:mannose-6-phosphate isomerase-like protein (cupin superfamily)
MVQSHQQMEREMASPPTIIDLKAELAKLTMFRGRTPQTTFRERRGTAAQLGLYRDGFLLLSKFDGKSHWETHPEDELFYILDGTMTVDIVCDDGPPKSIVLDAGTVATVPQDAWHRVHSAGGVTALSATLPSDHIDDDLDDPRTVAPEIKTEGRAPDVVDLNAALAKLTIFRELTPQSTRAERTGSGASLASYRDGILFATKFAGTCHWETHPADELVHILDGSATLEIVCDDGPPQSFVMNAGAIAVVPQGAWHRFHSAEGVTLMTATPLPGEHIELDVDDPRTVVRQPA